MYKTDLCLLLTQNNIKYHKITDTNAIQFEINNIRYTIFNHKGKYELIISFDLLNNSTQMGFMFNLLMIKENKLVFFESEEIVLTIKNY